MIFCASATLGMSNFDAPGRRTLPRAGIRFCIIAALATTAYTLIDDAGVHRVLASQALAPHGNTPVRAALVYASFESWATSLGMGLWLSAVNVRFRDVRHAVPFLIQFWLFASPVVFASSLVPQKWHALYAMNPMVGVLEGFRWSVLAAGPPPGITAAVSAGVSAVLLVSGALFFQKQQRAFADVG